MRYALSSGERWMKERKVDLSGHRVSRFAPPVKMVAADQEKSIHVWLAFSEKLETTREMYGPTTLGFLL